MKTPPEGTADWFEWARRRCVDHLRALASIRAAHEYISSLLHRWESQDLTALGALHAASVVAYTRPFADARTRDGKVTYPVVFVKKAVGFDRALHGHLVSLRNRLIGHGDYDLLPSTMYVQTVGDERLPIAMGINVKIMAGIEVKSLADRYQAHFAACMVAIEGRLNREIRDLAAQAQRHPEAFAATHNIPVSTGPWHNTTEFTNVPEPTGAASNVQEPRFSDGVSGYRYLMLRHQVALVTTGTYVIHESGKPTSITFDVDGS